MYTEEELLKRRAASKRHHEVNKDNPIYVARRAITARKSYLKNRARILAEHATEEWKARANKRVMERYHTEPELKRKMNSDRVARNWNIQDDEVVAFKAMYGQDCFYCGNEGTSIDHLTPRSRGGEERLYNLVPCCKSCNSSKRDRTPGEWY